MRHTLSSHPAFFLALLLSILMLMLLTMPRPAHGRPAIRAAYFVVYRTAVGTRLDNLPSITGHCGVCHYDFTEGGTRNPYGAAVELAIPRHADSDDGRQAAILSVGNFDQDGDGVSSGTEILDRAVYSNTPTFPGLNSTNVSQVANVDVNEILDYVVPAYGSEMLPPTIEIARQVVRVK